LRFRDKEVRRGVRLRAWWSPRLCLALLTLAIRAAPAAAADAAAAAPETNPLARDYVDLGIHGGIAWRGNVADSRYAPFGLNLGVTIDIGRAPYWGGIYADAAEFGGRDGVVDPITDRSPRVRAISAGWRAKVAIRLAPRLYLFPALGAGFGRLEYSSSVVLPGPVYRVRSNTASFDGFSVTADATFAYVWRFGAVTLQPLRVSSFLFESNRSPPYPAGYDYGIARNSALLAAAVGVSVDPAAMVLAVWDTVKGLSQWRHP
jgi:hypothetical protein